MDSTSTIFLGTLVVMMGVYVYLTRYGARHWAGSGVVKSDESWIMAPETRPRDFYYDVDTRILYREVAFRRVTSKPKLKFQVRMQPIYSTNLVYTPEILEVTFEAGVNPPRCENPFATFFNDPTTWKFSQVGPVSDEQMIDTRVEELQRELVAKEEQLIQERADKQAEVKDTLSTIGKLTRPPSTVIKEREAP